MPLDYIQRFLENSKRENTKKNRLENSWILMAKESVLSNSSFTIITLPHPAHGGPAKYCLDSANHKIYEIVTFKESLRSWFIDDSVKSDGTFLMSTPIDPLFLVLPILRAQCVDRAIPLQDLLSQRGFDKIVDYVVNLDRIADSKGPADLKAYKFNEEKMLKWLENKVRKLANFLKEKNMQVTAGAVSATFVSSSVKSNTVDEEFYLKYACGIISEYLKDDIIEKLEKQFDFNKELIEQIGNKRKLEVEDTEDIMNKKVKRYVPGYDSPCICSDYSEDNELYTEDQTSEEKESKPSTANSIVNPAPEEEKSKPSTSNSNVNQASEEEKSKPSTSNPSVNQAPEEEKSKPSTSNPIVNQAPEEEKSKPSTSNRIVNQAPDEEKSKPSTSNPIVNQAPAEEKSKQLTAKNKALQKAASGCKTISSFFNKK